jgi:hypothetical protein
MIVSVHVPRTGGTTFRNELRAQYGSLFVEDYTDQPWDNNYRPIPQWSLASCIHGHFRAAKYENLATELITWTRDPFDRALSHFCYWKKPRMITFLSTGTLLGRTSQPNFTFADFVEDPATHNMISRFIDVDIDRFNFIGRFEHFVEDFERFFGFPPRFHGQRTYKIPVDDSLRPRFKELNKQDYDLVKRLNERASKLNSTSTYFSLPRAEEEAWQTKSQ